jgi:catalase
VSSPRPTTTNAGIPVASDDHSLTAGANGPVLLQDHYLIEKNAQFNRERVPERVVHAKGGGAFGFFEVTEDVSQFTKAAVFQPGAKTKTLIRFSTVAGELGSPDTWRDPRGTAIKFYTSEGNYDLVGNNTPVFFIRDAIKFPDFIHSQKRRADNHLRDNNMQWDFWSLTPESAHQVTWLMGDRGLPKTWRNMNLYGSHTFLWVNAGGEKFWVKYHFKTDQGHDFLTQAEADRIAGADADFHIRDLWTTINRGDHPSWTLYVQIMPYADAADYRFNPFDLTKVWPHGEYPLIKVGRFVLDRNPENYFTQIEQAAFEPSNLVPGIGTSPDKMLQGRLFSYPDTHRYRIGPNYMDLPVNRPVAEVNSYSKDGPMRFSSTPDPVYAPNSYGGPHADPARYPEDAGATGLEQEILRSAYRLHDADDDFSQPGTLVRQVFSDEERERFIGNVSGHLSNGVTQPVLDRALDYWRSVDKATGDKIAEKVQR